MGTLEMGLALCIVFQTSSPEMGMWIDRWLQDLRRNGASSNELRRSVRTLAEAVTLNDWSHLSVCHFVRFILQCAMGE